ncbi:MAG: restriction endonuclease subunit S [Anaerolineales bacterium]|nr:restriction endonuclease subunit S [Anaerolineales bacterium]
MKKGLEAKKLGELCTIKGRIGYRGYTKQDLVSKGEGAISLSPSNIIDKDFDLENCTYISWFKYEESPEIMIFNGDIIFVKTGSSFGKSALVEELPEKATINPQLVVFKNITCVNKYLYYAVNSVEFKTQVNKIIGGTAIPTLSQANLAELSIPVPPLPEQQRIVALLDETFAALTKVHANAERNQVNAREVFDSALEDIFGNLLVNDKTQQTQIGDIALVQGGYSFKSKDFKSKGKYQVIRMGNVRPDVLRLEENPVFVDNIDSDVLERALLKQNDVIITQTGTKKKRDYGYTVLISQPNLLLNQRLSKIRFPENYLPKFFLYYSWTNFFKDQFFADETGTVGQGNVGKAGITDTFIPLLPFTEQRAIVQRLDALAKETRRLEEVYRSKVEAVEELRRSVLGKAFAGEL